MALEIETTSDEFIPFQSSREELFTISHRLEQNLRFEYAIIYSAERGKLVLHSLLSS